MVTDDVAGLAAFYARLTGSDVTLNDYYVEVPAGPASIGFSRRRFTEHSAADGIILDFLVPDVDAEYRRLAALGAGWVLRPADQPWGSRSMMLADPAGTLINVFSRRSRS